MLLEAARRKRIGLHLTKAIDARCEGESLC